MFDAKTLKKNIQFLKNVGPKKANLFYKLEIKTIEDLLYHFPRDYICRAKARTVQELKNDTAAVIEGRVVGLREIRPKKGLLVIKVRLTDGIDFFDANFFNQPYLSNKFKLGDRLSLYGKVDKKFSVIQINVIDYELISLTQLQQKDNLIVPVYQATAGLSQKFLRNLIKSLLDSLGPIEEFLPKNIVKKYALSDRDQAFRDIHFPVDCQSLKQAQLRLKFEESFLFQFGLKLIKKQYDQNQAGLVHSTGGKLTASVLARLSFDLTASQKRVWREICSDMESSKPMNRLIQGDVGCGKTIIAILALAKTVENNFQGVLMVPTEILAEQHYFSLKKYFSAFDVSIVLLTGTLSPKEKARILDQIAAGQADIIIGTHAILEEKVIFKKPGLIIIDEQHRFGVRQRAILQFKGQVPDVLIMTATPIPRTLAMTFYSDLDLSVIAEMPLGRKAVRTYWVTLDYLKRVYNFIRKKVTQKQQVYIVCPLIEESENIQTQAAEELYQELKSEIFPDLAVGLLHGRMKPAEKENVMQQFKNNKFSILVSTTIVEVGVDIPNATLMVIFGAERFGLSQLHQLRGRVGRGSEQAYCILLGNPQTNQGKSRLKILQRYADGFKIAEEDLKLRGPGEFFGTKQSGLVKFKLIDFSQDLQIITDTKKEVEMVLAEDQTRISHVNNIYQAYLDYFQDQFDYVKIR